MTENQSDHHMRCAVIMAASVNIYIFWNVTPCSLVTNTKGRRVNYTGYNVNLQGRDSMWCSWSIIPSLLNLENRQKWVGNLESQPLHPQGNGIVDRSQGSDWANQTRAELWRLHCHCEGSGCDFLTAALTINQVESWIVAIVSEKFSSSSMLVRIYQSTGCNIQESLNLQCEIRHKNTERKGGIKILFEHVRHTTWHDIPKDLTMISDYQLCWVIKWQLNWKTNCWCSR